MTWPGDDMRLSGRNPEDASGKRILLINHACRREGACEGVSIECSDLTRTRSRLLFPYPFMKCCQRCKYFLDSQEESVVLNLKLDPGGIYKP